MRRGVATCIMDSGWRGAVLALHILVILLGLVKPTHNFTRQCATEYSEQNEVDNGALGVSTSDVETQFESCLGRGIISGVNENDCKQAWVNKPASMRRK